MKNANPVFHGVSDGRAPATWGCIFRIARPALLVAVVAVGFSGCGKQKAASMLTAAATNPRSAGDFFPIKVGEKVVRMQLAVRLSEMQHGLMGRRDLGPDDGMLFVYDKPQPLSFWMRNTPTPLDIGFFNAAGVLEEIYPMHPFDEARVAARSRELQFALEVNQGWFQANGVKPGAQLDRKVLADALRERGFTARKFGFPEAK